MPRERKPIILTCVAAFWPGNEASGPNLSVEAMISALRDDFDFYRLALDRPRGGDTSLASDESWRDDGLGGRLRYCAPGVIAAARRLSILRETPHDLLLLNSFHDPEFSIPALAARKLGLLPRKPAILSPRGEFSRAALSIKPARKTAYRLAARGAGLFDDIWLHATSEAERDDIKRALPVEKGLFFATNIRRLPEPVAHRSAEGGRLRVKFLARVSRLKNLDLALEALALCSANIDFEIYGPLEDAEHWAACEARIATLPERICVRYCGVLANDAVRDMFAGADLLFLPSRSESFGHSIFEALACGVPVLIGDATPWKNLQADCGGWDLPIDPRRFAGALDLYAGMDANARAAWRAGARQRAERWVKDNDSVAMTRSMLLAAMTEGETCAASPA